jgi:hypothetical protein
MFKDRAGGMTGLFVQVECLAMVGFICTLSVGLDNPCSNNDPDRGRERQGRPD